MAATDTVDLPAGHTPVATDQEDNVTVQREELHEDIRDTDLANWLCGDFFTRYRAALAAKEAPVVPERPFDHLYKSRELLTVLLGDVEDRLPADAEARGRLLFLIAETHIEAEEFSVGEKLVTRASAMLQPYELEPSCCTLAIAALNLSAFVWSQLKDHAKAAVPLQRAELLYTGYLARHGPAADGAAALSDNDLSASLAILSTSDAPVATAATATVTQDDGDADSGAPAASKDEATSATAAPALATPSLSSRTSQEWGSVAAATIIPPAAAPWTSTELLPTRAPAERFAAFEAAFTTTTFFLAQCMPLLGHDEQGAAYCLRTLSRQHVAGESANMDWVVNCAAMSQYFLPYFAYEDARYCLACATCMERTLPRDSMTQAAMGAAADEPEDVHAQELANVGRCWIRYYAGLLGAGQDLATGRISEETMASERARVRVGLSFAPPGVAELEATVPAEPPRNFAEARTLFLQAQGWLARALEVFRLDGFTSDHVATVQEHSQLFHLLSQYESDHERACKMQKRRITMLQPLAAELNPQHYLAICKQLSYELGEAHMRMMELKMDLLESQQQAGKITPANVVKINRLIQSGITYFTNFIDYHRDAQRELPSKFEDAAEHSVLMAHFWIARLHSKLITADKRQVAENLDAAQKCYAYVVDYVERNPKTSLSESELGIAREMAELLPLKIMRLRSS